MVPVVIFLVWLFLHRVRRGIERAPPESANRAD
jgi:hypothetical protein